MKNALHELEKEISYIGKSLDDIAYAKVCLWPCCDDEPTNVWTHSDPIDDLDFRYDDGFGAQELFGYVVFSDGSWLERYEYDGAERWEYKKTPSREEVEACE